MATTAGAQKTTPPHVPAVVKQAVATKFPGAGKVEWKRKSDRMFEAEFTRKRIDIAAKFDSTGAWQETEASIVKSDLPPAVLAAAGKEFPGAKIIETQSVVRRGSDDRVFEVHFENATRTMKAQFARDGKVIAKSEKPKAAAPGK